ncbi:F-box domain protein [Talaromyces stipitatus ATCC 10500]|uniref:F-box domain protein n=1 Tax=Talaromyces stipitatus (strain ATCC 10500 / CBS 375.48 / QM 6759 / NRRL 1006) TaxID=441959 RepID=B8MB41_TALSN|nr:F-box domain protein [Talaromyces stipitatus ATCC 10500]EED18742.1 F-box domain protein [Talaromyces stipitatus ATCC 10500]
MASSWWSESSNQTTSDTLPQKPLHWSDDWDAATEPFPELTIEPHSAESTADIIALDSSDLQSKGYLSSSPCISEDTTLSDNDASSPDSSSPDLSASETSSSETEWRGGGNLCKHIPAANRTPPEILFQIYAMLSPRDFDNARRTCSQWMRASLHQKLLESMLKRAGWWDAWQRDCQTYQPIDGVEESLVWRLSKRFSTECVLSGRKVNVEKSGFLPTGVVDFGQLSRESLPKESPGLSRDMFNGSAPRLTAALRDPAFSRSIKFSVSTCGHYVLVATGCMIYVYYLGNRKRGDSGPPRLSEATPEDLFLGDNDLDILPVSSIGCPYEILSATIDTSTPRFVIAALLRGRVGMICDIKGVPVHTSPEQPSPFLRKRSSTREDIPADQARKMDEFRDAIASSAVVEQATTSGRPPMGPRTVSTRRTMNRLTRAPRKYFHDICSVEDPPRSVSICPGRRCVAFGCGSGIELHWVDEKTQEDSRKMFPLSQPAEILHFLPSRVEIDEASKLRLISSLAGPGASGCQCHRAANGEDVVCQFHLSSRVNAFTHWTPRKNGRLSLVKATHCHHYRAMPVNDGLHILFIEPVTGYLCIGSDAPIGGPTNLTRAMICIPPSDQGLDTEEARIPTIFAVGSDLSRGLRIVAAYQDRIILYTVPVDVYNVLRRERQLQGDNVMGDSDLARDWFLDNERNSKRRGSLAQNQNGDWEFLLRVSYRPTAMLWPLKIYGKEIGRMDKVVDFSVQTSNGGVRVWAFGASGEARIFDIDTYTTKTRLAMHVAIKALNVASDGSIGSASFMDRAESGLLSPLPIKASRKRKHLSQPAAFDRKLLSMWNSSNTTSTHKDNDTVAPEAGPTSSSSRPPTGISARTDRRQSFAACIMDLRIPELGTRDGQWTDPNRASTVPSTPACGPETAEFHDVASYDPKEIRKFYTVWSTSASKPSPGRWR